MKALVCTLVFSGLIFSINAQPADYEKKIKHFQDSLNAIQANKETTQIIEEEFLDFSGLRFYPINALYKIEARLEKTDTPQTFKLTYSNDPNVPVYVSYGQVKFTFSGKDYALKVYQNQEWLGDDTYKNHLFLPFKDWTNGPESYGGGRFMDLRIPAQGDSITLDFNCSYNPPCAYNYYMACPLIPESNYIETEIFAGILAY